MMFRSWVDDAVSELAARRAMPPQDAAARRRRARFANVLLRTHEGAAVRFYDDLLKDKTVLIQFMYTHCTERCPMTTARLAEVQQLLGARVGTEIFMYSITVDPEHDTPAVLRAYARMARARPGWLFLTGDARDVLRLRANFGDDPALAFGSSNHLNLISYGVEPLERWGGFPAWSEAATMVRLLSSITVPGAHARS
jgi:protein SCO1